MGKYNQPIIRDPEPPPACDYLLIESTYGDRLHDVEEPKDALERIVNDAAARNAAVLIPAFAVGRRGACVLAEAKLEDAAESVDHVLTRLGAGLTLTERTGNLGYGCDDPAVLPLLVDDGETQ